MIAINRLLAKNKNTFPRAKLMAEKARNIFLPYLSEYDPIIGWIKSVNPLPINDNVPIIVLLKFKFENR